MKTYTLDYNPELLKQIKNQPIVVYTHSLDALTQQYLESKRHNQVMAMVVTLPFTSVSQIEFKEEWAEIPLVIQAYNIGDYDTFFFKVHDIRHLNIRIYLSSKSQSVFTDLKIMSSVGVDCGLLLESDIALEDEKLLDLASYYYMSPAQHATIEPFEFILRHLRDESNENFNSVYFTHPLLYQKIESLEDLEQETSDETHFDCKMQEYYQHFMHLDACSKCPAFKICNQQMHSILAQCAATMNEVFEYAELRNEMNHHQSCPKTICQL